MTLWCKSKLEFLIITANLWFNNRECDINPHVVTEFTMRSDGRFSMLIDGVSLQSGNRKLVEKDLYCCLQHHFVLFGPKLTNVPPLKVLNLEDCMLVKTTKKELHIKDGNEDHTIRYSSEEQAKQWAEKVSLSILGEYWDTYCVIIFLFLDKRDFSIHIYTRLQNELSK